MTPGEERAASVLSRGPADPVDPVDPLVGRARELDRVCSAGEALRHGRGRLVVVAGEAGVGKTRFCAEVAARYRATGAQVVEARCWLDGAAPPLWPWQPLLAELSEEGMPLPTAVDLDDLDDLDGSGPDRFARFVAVADRVAEACVRRPLVLVVDDVHGADRGALLLTRFVARSLPRLPLLLVLARRPDEPAGGSEEARLLDEIERAATSVALGNFDLAASEEFLVAHGVDTSIPGLTTTLFNLTRGNPLHLRRAARTVQTVPTTGTTPSGHGGLRLAIQQAFDGLGPEERRVLSCGTVLGLSPVVAETAEVAGCGAVAVLDAAAAGVTAGLVTTVHEDGRFSFGHELVRAAIEDGLGAADRLAAHARAAEVVAAHDGAGRTAHRLARAARHACCAAPRSGDDARLAVARCEAAAQAMVRSHAYEQADELLTAAVELHASARLGPPPALLTLQWAQAASLRGHLRTGRERYDVTVTRARAEDRPVLLAEAVLGWGGVWLDDYPTLADKARMLDLCREALDGLPRDDPRYEAPRCRLRVRLAGEAAYAGGPAGPLHAAVAATRATGDRRALAEALALAQHALFTPEHTRTRPALDDELVRITTRTDQGLLALVGLLWRTVNLLHLGDPQFVRAIEVLRERATALGNEHMLYHLGIVDVLLTIGQGRLDDAEAQAARCLELGTQIGRVDAFAYFAAQLGTVRWLQGRDAELLDHVGEVATSPVLADSEFSVWALAACLAARAGDHDRARAVLRHCLPTRLGDLAPSGTWMAGMVALVEAAVALGEHDIAAQAYDLLEPHADLPAVAGLGIVCLGSVERSLGLAAGLLGRHDRAVAHLERAVVANQRIANRPLLALSRAALAAALLRRPEPAPDDHGRAGQLLRRAIRDGREMGLTGRVATWEAELAATAPAPAMGDEPVAATEPVTAEPVAAGSGEGVIRRNGRRWVLAVDGRRIRVPNLVGMRYLAELLTNPGQRIPAVHLADQAPGTRQPHRQEVLDEQARRAYADRARELDADLADAEAANDLHRAERLRHELDLLVDQLESAAGLGGRPRHFPDDHERARVAVQKAIKRAVDAVDNADPALADLLRQTITTGLTCTYTPCVETPVVWSARSASSASDAEVTVRR